MLCADIEEQKNTKLEKFSVRKQKIDKTFLWLIKKFRSLPRVKTGSELSINSRKCTRLICLVATNSSCRMLLFRLVQLADKIFFWTKTSLLLLLGERRYNTKTLRNEWNTTEKCWADGGFFLCYDNKSAHVQRRENWRKKRLKQVYKNCVYEA